MFDIFKLLEGIISSAPEAVELWNKISGLIEPKSNVPQNQVDVINELAPIAHAAVDTLHQAIGTIINSHGGVAPTN